MSVEYYDTDFDDDETEPGTDMDDDPRGPRTGRFRVNLAGVRSTFSYAQEPNVLDDRNPFIRSVTFNLAHSPAKATDVHTITFRGAKRTEEEAVQIAERYLSRPMKWSYYSKIKHALSSQPPPRWNALARREQFKVRGDALGSKNYVAYVRVDNDAMRIVNGVPPSVPSPLQRRSSERRPSLRRSSERSPSQRRSSEINRVRDSATTAPRHTPVERSSYQSSILGAQYEDEDEDDDNRNGSRSEEY
jgi:hypothetical protein